MKKTNEPWGLGYSVKGHKDFFIKDIKTGKWWIHTKVIGVLSMFSSSVRVSEGKKYIPFEEGLRLSPNDVKADLIATQAKCEKVRPE